MATPVQNPIDTAEREIRRDREDLARLQRRYPGYDFLPTSNGTTASIAVSSQTTTPEASVYLSAIEQAVLGAVNAAPGSEFTSRTVIEALRTSGSYRLSENDDAAMNHVGIA